MSIVGLSAGRPRQDRFLHFFLSPFHLFFMLTAFSLLLVPILLIHVRIRPVNDDNHNSWPQLSLTSCDSALLAGLAFVSWKSICLVFPCEASLLSWRNDYFVRFLCSYL